MVQHMPILQLIEYQADLSQELADLKVTRIFHPDRVSDDQLIDLETALQAAMDLIDQQLSLPTT